MWLSSGCVRRWYGPRRCRAPVVAPPLLTVSGPKRPFEAGALGYIEHADSGQAKASKSTPNFTEKSWRLGKATAFQFYLSVEGILPCLRSGGHRTRFFGCATVARRSRDGRATVGRHLALAERFWGPTNTNARNTNTKTSKLMFCLRRTRKSMFAISFSAFPHLWIRRATGPRPGRSNTTT